MFNIVTNIEHCSVVIGQMVNNDFSLLYYSHFPTLIVSILLGLFVFFKNKKLLSGKIFLAICLSFSLWLICNFVLWKDNDSRRIMFFWSIMGILDALFFILSFYFVYVFINEKDISFKSKLALGLIFLPIVVLTPTQYNLSNFILADCEAIENDVFLNYLFFVEILMLLCIMIFSIRKYIKADKEKRKQIFLLALGIIIFVLSFFIAGYVADLLYDVIFGSYKIEFYGLFGMPVFLGILAYLIVKFKVFNIKLIGAQALVYALVILVGSQFFFIQNRTNQILTGITLILAIGFGIFLIKSVKNEVKRKEELQDMMEKLAIANDELRKLDNTKSEFISIASHQLRTPLTSIKGYVSLILEGTYGKVDSHISDPLNKIYASNERLIQLVEDLLNVSRIESGRMEYQFAKHNLASMLKELYDTFSVIARGRGLYLHLYFPENPLPEIEIDGGKTREVISNLIDNAIKYTRRGGITIKAESLVNPEKNEAVVKVTVSDTGMGVPKTELPYLFSKFSRGKDTSRLHVGGTGLGLYVGKSMIEAQHGKIYVESEGEGKGSKFIVEMPIAQPK